MRLMGHFSVTTSQRYVHPTPKALESAVRKLEMLNQKSSGKASSVEKQQLPATIAATLSGAIAVSH